MSTPATDFSRGVDSAFSALGKQAPPSGESKVVGAAKDFEALLLTQILKSTHEEAGWLGTNDDDAGEAAIGIGEEQLARVMANSGGLGLSHLIDAGLRHEQSVADQANAATQSVSAEPASPEHPE